MSLPYDAEIEWLEKTASGPYIDTGVVTKAKTDSFALEINMTYDRVHNLRRLHGADNGRFVGCSANSSLWDMGNVSFVYGDFHRVRSEVSANGGWAFSVDGAAPYRTGTTTATSENSTYIFSIATNDSTVARYESIYCRVKDAKVWKNGALVRDLIPVRVGQVGMMYDRVSKQLFGNSGTGSFVLGPDVYVPPKGISLFLGRKTEVRTMPTARDYVQDGLIAMWDGKENAGWDTHEDGTIPVNLVTGSSDLTVYPANTPSRADYFAFDGSYRLNISPSVTPVTIECCLEYDPSNLGTDGTFGVCRVGGHNYNDPKIVLISKDGVCYFPSAYAVYTKNCVIQNGKATLSLVKTSNMYARRFVNGVVSDSDSGVNLGTGWGLSGNVGIGYVISRTLVGVVHSIRAYSRALTDDEIAANYAVDARRFGL